MFWSSYDIINITKILRQGMFSKIKRVYSKMLVIKVNDLIIFKGAYESIKYKLIASTLFWSNSIDTFNGPIVLRIHF